MGLNIGILESSRTNATTPLLLDTYSGAAAAFSIRKLRTAYTGYCMQVKRVSDGVTLDVGFDGAGLLDTSSLMTFIGTGDAWVTIWYDQSGNARNAQTYILASSPKIVIAGVLQTQLSKPTVKFSTSTQCGLRNIFNLTNPFSMIGVLAQDSGAALSTRIFSSDNSSNLLTISRGNVTSVYTNGNVCNFPSRVMGQTYLVSFMRQTTNSYVYQNGASVTNSATLSNDFGLFAMNSTIGATEGVESRISEVILYPSNQLSNISGINSNINTYYSIY